VRASRVFAFRAALGKRLTFSIRRAEDVAFRRHHHVVEVLGEHCCGEESDGAQGFFTDINKVVFYGRWNGKNTPRTDGVRAAIFHVQFPGAGDNVLRLFSSIGMPAEPFPRLDLINDRRRRGRAVATVNGESTGPMNRVIVLSPDFSALKFIRCNDWIHEVEAKVWLFLVNNRNASGALQLTSALGGPLRKGFGEHFGHMLWPDICKIADLMPATCP
jgi:hypothetical protein